MKTIKSQKSSADPEQMAKNLRKIVADLKTQLAICNNDMNRALEDMKTKYGIDSISAGVKRVEELNKILRLKNEELERISNRISSAMEKYQNG